MIDLKPDAPLSSLTADLLTYKTFDADGQEKSLGIDDPDFWTDEPELKPEIVSLGPVRFRILDGDPVELAVAAGVIEQGEEMTMSCLRVEFEPVEGLVAPQMGNYIAVNLADSEVKILYRVWLGYDDLHAEVPFDLGADAMHDEALDVIGPGQALLVQCFDQADETAAA